MVDVSELYPFTCQFFFFFYKHVHICLEYANSRNIIIWYIKFKYMIGLYDQIIMNIKYLTINIIYLPINEGSLGYFKFIRTSLSIKSRGWFWF